ncbi:hypothetical protein IJ00_04100 [Calothrix sp. 336/3]|nr:hypothetical protein IJ00_04100 [Calothrix sp. 336/3]
MLIAPLATASANSVSVELSEAVDRNSGVISPSSLGTNPNNSTNPSQIVENPSVENSVLISSHPGDQSSTGVSSSLTEDNFLAADVADTKALAAVELAPQVTPKTIDRGVSSRQDLVQKLRASKIQSISVNNGVVAIESAKVLPGTKDSQYQEVTVIADPNGAQIAQEDPLGSPHPIPWKWIMATHEAIGAKGGSGTRYYRSTPVVSPDGKYAAYSRVQLEIKPELYNSRVSSVLFIEERKTGKLQVVSATSRNMDSLVRQNIAEDPNGVGTIGVLVPVSWSQNGDRFLARKFEAVFNTSDVTDHAVIWDQKQNQANTVSPTHGEQEHEKISVLLGWSKTQPGNVLFRSGEMGEENWSLLAVSDNGTTVAATNADQPVTFGDKNQPLWAGPQVASR